MLLKDAFDETLLVRRLRKDDIEAFNAFYWKYHEAIYRNIFRITKNEESSADLLQDVFVKFWERRKNLLPEKSVSGLLFVISYHLALNHIKRAINDSLVMNELSILSVEDNDDHLHIESQHELLEKAIDNLTIKRRMVFVGCKIEGKSYQQVADELGISKHTVKEHLTIASRTVKDYILSHSDPYMTSLLVFLLYI